MSTLFCGTNQENVLQKERAHQSLQSLFFNFFLIMEQTFMTSARGREGLDICHMVINSVAFNQQIYDPFLQMKCGMVCDLVVCEHHNCMISNIETYFDKEITFPTLVLVLQ